MIKERRCKTLIENAKLRGKTNSKKSESEYIKGEKVKLNTNKDVLFKKKDKNTNIA